MAAPVIVQPTLGGQIAQAAGQYPEDQQKLAMQQAELDAQTIDSSSKRLSVLSKMFSSNPGVATNPQMIQATQRAFKGLGMDAPMKNVNGVPSLDTDALYAFGPASDFISQNLGMLLQFKPDQRGSLVQAATGQALPDGITQRLSSLPQRMISTPSELSGLYSRATQAIDNLRFPGATVDGTISIIKPINEVLQENGMPGIDMQDLENSGVYQSLLNQAQLQGLQGKAAEQFAQAGLAKIRTTLAPGLAQDSHTRAAADTTRAAASVTSADASASRAATEAYKAPAEVQRDYAEAGQAQAKTRQIIQQAATGGGSLKDLQTFATTTEQQAERLDAYVNGNNQNNPGLKIQIQNLTTEYSSTTLHPQGLQDPQYLAQHKQLNDELYNYQHRVIAARRAAAEAQGAVQSAQARLHAGSTGGNHPAGGVAPHDMRPGTLEYYNSLTPEQKQQYAQNPNVPQDVREYLKNLP